VSVTDALSSVACPVVGCPVVGCPVVGCPVVVGAPLMAVVDVAETPEVVVMVAPRLSASVVGKVSLKALSSRMHAAPPATRAAQRRA
jgi:hypothetical protein